MHKLKENAKKELKMIEEKGLTASNIDNAYKLVEIVKGVDKINMIEDPEYSRDRGNSYYSREREYDNNMSRTYDDDNSYKKGRNMMTGEYMHRPDYSRASNDGRSMEAYRSEKSRYSNERDPRAKEKMLDALEIFMSDTTMLLKQIFEDADTREEREIITKYARKIAEM